MIIHVYRTPEEMGNEAARLIAEKLNAAIAQKGEARLLLSTGASQFEMMDALKAAVVQQAVVSNKPNAQVKSLCALYFGQYVTLDAGDREGVKRKPEPDAVWMAMSEMGAEDSRTLYVGDSDVDVITARNAGVDCAAVTWGFRSEAELRQAGAVHLFDTAEALTDWILNG